MRHNSTLRRHPTVEPGGRSVTIGPLHPAYTSGRSIFPSRIFDPSEVKRVLKTGHQNRKIGKFVTKGPRRGWPIYMLTLEERATCPRSCKAWGYCYGNQSQAGERIVAGPELEAALEVELAELQQRHPGGFMVRLHVLGDFYSKDYVGLWWRALSTLPALHIFGFTARPLESEIGQLLNRMLAVFGYRRFAMRFSGYPWPDHASILLGDEGSENAIQCPAQTGATECCATCALCWQSKRSIAFARH